MRNLLLTMFLLLSSHSAYACFDKGQSNKANFDNCLVAAEQGEAYAQYNLALMYDKGQGVTQDYKQAVKWYRKAAEQGKANAQHNLGVAYEQGIGVKQDKKLAHMWFNIAASSGHESATGGRDRIAEKLSSSEIEKAQRWAREWTAKH